jgi:hypothetical protein
MGNADLEFLKSRLNGRMGLFSRAHDEHVKDPHEDDDEPDNVSHSDDEVSGLSESPRLAAPALEDHFDGTSIPPVIFKSEDSFWDKDQVNKAGGDIDFQHINESAHYDVPAHETKSDDQSHFTDAHSIMSFAYSEQDNDKNIDQSHNNNTVKTGEDMNLFARSKPAASGASSLFTKRPTALTEQSLPATSLFASAETQQTADKHFVEQTFSSATNQDPDYMTSFADNEPEQELKTAEYASDMRGVVFSKIVKSDDDLVGLVAYSLYKLNKYDWATAFQKSKGRAPSQNEIESFAIGESMLRRLMVYRQLAEQILSGQNIYAPSTYSAKKGAQSTSINQKISSSLPTVIYLLLAVGSVFAGFAAFRYISTLVGR